jgi:hypothetical protein
MELPFYPKALLKTLLLPPAGPRLAALAALAALTLLRRSHEPGRFLAWTGVGATFAPSSHSSRARAQRS